MTKRSDDWQNLLAPLASDSALRPFVQDGALFIWSLDGCRLLHANAAGHAIWGTNDDELVSPARDRLRLLGTGLAPRTGVRLERLKLLPHAGAVLITCACRLLASDKADGEPALLTAIGTQELARIGFPPSRLKSEIAEPSVAHLPGVEVSNVDIVASAEFAAAAAIRPFRFTWEADADGRVTAVSQTFAQLAGQAAATAIVGRTWSDLLANDAVDLHGRFADALNCRETFSACPLIWRLENGATGQPFQMSAMPVLTEVGFAGFCGFGVVPAGADVPLHAPNTPVASDHATGSQVENRGNDVPPESVAEDSQPLFVPEQGAGLTDNSESIQPFVSAALAVVENEKAVDPQPENTASITAENDPNAAGSEKPASAGRHLRLVPMPKPGGVQAPAANGQGTSEIAGRPALTSAERNAFREIAQALGARLEAGTQKAPAGMKLPELSAPRAVEPVAKAAEDDAPASMQSGLSPIVFDDGALEKPVSGLSALDEAAVKDAANVSGATFDVPPLDPPQAVLTAPLNASGSTKILPLADMGSSDDEDAPGSALPERVTVADDVEQSPSIAQPNSHSHADLLDRLPIAVAVTRENLVLYANRTLLDLLDYADVDALNAGGGMAQAISGQIGESPAIVMLKDRHYASFPVDAHSSATSWNNQNATLMSFRKAGSDAEIRAKVDALTLDVAAGEARLSEMTAVLDTATDGVVTVDERGRLLSMNRSAEALFGYDQREVAGDLFTLLLAPESHSRALDYLEGLKGGGVASVLNDGREVMGRVRQGGRITLFMTMGQIAEAGPAMEGGRRFCAVLRDITAWKKTELELVEARKAAERASAQKSDVLAKISHEIRTPLNAIIGFSEVMAEERFGPIGNERYKEYLRDIHESGGYVISLVNDLLDLAKIEAGKLDLDFVSVSLNEIAASAVALLQPEAQRGRVVLRTGLSPKLPPVVADERSIRQIMINVLSNAVKFTDAGGQVIVSTALGDKGEAIIRVRDTGIGMTEADLKLAMEPFRQVPSTRKAGGTGLGLPLTKALVEANRASLAITSARNEGTLIEIIFPPQRVLAS